MLHLIYILAFTILAVIAVANLIRNLIMFSFERERNYPPEYPARNSQGKKQFVPHPELLDNAGNLIKEPLLVMRSVNVDDARQQLDALYESSPGQKIDHQEDA